MAESIGLAPPERAAVDFIVAKPVRQEALLAVIARECLSRKAS